MRLDDALADRQAQPGAAVRPRAGSIDPIEPLADMRQMFRRYPFARVGYRYHHLTPLFLDAEENSSILGRVAECVLQQVDKQAGQMMRIAPNTERRIRGFHDYGRAGSARCGDLLRLLQHVSYSE